MCLYAPHKIIVLVLLGVRAFLELDENLLRLLRGLVYLTTSFGRSQMFRVLSRGPLQTRRSFFIAHGTPSDLWLVEPIIVQPWSWWSLFCRLTDSIKVAARMIQDNDKEINDDIDDDPGFST